MIIKQSATNQLWFPLPIDLSQYDLLSFGFYQDGRCVAYYLSTDTEYVKLNPDYSVSIYMLASVAKKFGPQRVSFEVSTWNGEAFELLVSETMDVEVCRSNERSSIVDTDDTEITDPRIRAEIERVALKYIQDAADKTLTDFNDRLTQLELTTGIEVYELKSDDNGYLYLGHEHVEEDDTDET